MTHPFVVSVSVMAVSLDPFSGLLEIVLSEPVHLQQFVPQLISVSIDGTAFRTQFQLNDTILTIRPTPPNIMRFKAGNTDAVNLLNFANHRNVSAYITLATGAISTFEPWAVNVFGSPISVAFSCLYISPLECHFSYADCSR